MRPFVLVWLIRSFVRWVGEQTSVLLSSTERDRVRMYGTRPIPRPRASVRRRRVGGVRVGRRDDGRDGGEKGRMRASMSVVMTSTEGEYVSMRE